MKARKWMPGPQTPQEENSIQPGADMDGVLKALPVAFLKMDTMGFCFSRPRGVWGEATQAISLSCVLSAGEHLVLLLQITDHEKWFSGFPVPTSAFWEVRPQPSRFTLLGFLFPSKDVCKSSFPVGLFLTCTLALSVWSLSPSSSAHLHQEKERL